MKRQSLSLAVVTLSLLVLALGCTRKESSSSSMSVHLATWTNYVSDDVLKDFTVKTGIQVQISNYSSNEELLAKLQAGATGYDVAIPSDYMVAAMRELKLLEAVDRSKMTSFNELDPKLLAQGFDPKNEVSIPYTWGTTGLAVNRTLFTGAIKGWKDVFEAKALHGKISLLDDSREVVGLALKLHGLSLNDARSDSLQQAEKKLRELKPAIKRFTSEPMTDLVNGEVTVAQAYSVDALKARDRTGGKVDYVIPEEGCTLFIDNFVIPKGGKNIENAHRLINYLVGAEANARTLEKVKIAPVNLKTAALISEELKNDRILFPETEKLSKCEMMHDLGAEIEKVDRVWTEVKLAR